MCVLGQEHRCIIAQKCIWHPGEFFFKENNGRFLLRKLLSASYHALKTELFGKKRGKIFCEEAGLTLGLICPAQKKKKKKKKARQLEPWFVAYQNSLAATPYGCYREGKRLCTCGNKRNGKEATTWRKLKAWPGGSSSCRSWRNALPGPKLGLPQGFRSGVCF